MGMNDLFFQKRRKLKTLMKMRKQVPESDGKLSAGSRLKLLLDPGSFKETEAHMVTADPIAFPGYDQKLADAEAETGLKEAVVTGIGKINKCPVAIAVLDSGFLMGSMGTVVGEKIVRLTELADRRKLPLVIVSASGGARMQEGLFSLLQMARTSAAVRRFQNHGGLYISVLTHPTTGGVSASFANLGDIIIAEPEALICFAGPRVIEQTIGEKLPEGFQKSEFLLAHGMIDLITERKQMKMTLYQLLKMHQKVKK